MNLILPLLLALAVALCLYLAHRTAALQRDKQQLSDELAHRDELHRVELAHAEELRQQQQEQWQQNLQQMEDRFKNLAADILTRKSAELKTGNSEQLNAVLHPLREQLTELGKAVRETNRETAGTKAALGEQLRQLMQRTAELDAGAQELTRALRGDSKKQGDWGEMVLATLLEKSGLQRGLHFQLQEDITDEEAAHYRPDAIVRFPGQRCVIVDSKVSLSAYTRAVNADDPEQQKRELRAHLDSVKKHVAELAEKKYPTLVPGAVGYVLMFIPNEGSYLAAVHADPELVNEAYRSGVIIVNPTNLLMALQLAYNLWQNELQVSNVKKIIDRATTLYEKLVGVQTSFANAKDKLRAASDALEQADDRLSHGRGSFARQVEMLREFGVDSKKKLALPDEDEPAPLSEAPDAAD